VNQRPKKKEGLTKKVFSGREDTIEIEELKNAKWQMEKWRYGRRQGLRDPDGLLPISIWHFSILNFSIPRLFNSSILPTIPPECPKCGLTFAISLLKNSSPEGAVMPVLPSQNIAACATEALG